jgi:hypothetical protein
MIPDFLRLVEAYCIATELAEATVSTRIFNDGKAIESIRRGRDVGVNRLNTAILLLSEKWPAKAKWPKGIERPEPVKAAS